MNSNPNNTATNINCNSNPQTFAQQSPPSDSIIQMLVRCNRDEPYLRVSLKDRNLTFQDLQSIKNWLGAQERSVNIFEIMNCKLGGNAFDILHQIFLAQRCIATLKLENHSLNPQEVISLLSTMKGLTLTEFHIADISLDEKALSDLSQVLFKQPIHTLKIKLAAIESLINIWGQGLFEHDTLGSGSIRSLEVYGRVLNPQEYDRLSVWFPNLSSFYCDCAAPTTVPETLQRFIKRNQEEQASAKRQLSSQPVRLGEAQAMIEQYDPQQSSFDRGWFKLLLGEKDAIADVLTMTQTISDESNDKHVLLAAEIGFLSGLTEEIKNAQLSRKYDLALLTDDAQPEEGKFYIRMKNRNLEYKVKTVKGESVIGKLGEAELKKVFTPEELSQFTEFRPEKLKPFLEKLLKITTSRGHTEDDKVRQIQEEKLKKKLYEILAVELEGCLSAIAYKATILTSYVQEGRVVEIPEACDLYMMTTSLFLESNQKNDVYNNNYIWLSDSEQLYFVQAGEPKRIKLQSVNLFLTQINFEKNKQSLSYEKIHEIIVSNSNHVFYDGHPLKYREKYRNNLQYRSKTLYNNLAGEVKQSTDLSELQEVFEQRLLEREKEIKQIQRLMNESQAKSSKSLKCLENLSAIWINHRFQRKLPPEYLHYADAIKMDFLEEPIDVNAKLAKGKTLLGLAYERDAVEIVKLLLERGASPFEPYTEKGNSIFLSILKNKDESIKKKSREVIIKFIKGHTVTQLWSDIVHIIHQEDVKELEGIKKHLDEYLDVLLHWQGKSWFEKIFSFESHDINRTNELVDYYKHLEEASKMVHLGKVLREMIVLARGAKRGFSIFSVPLFRKQSKLHDAVMKLTEMFKERLDKNYELVVKENRDLQKQVYESNAMIEELQKQIKENEKRYQQEIDDLKKQLSEQGERYIEQEEQHKQKLDNLETQFSEREEQSKQKIDNLEKQLSEREEQSKQKIDNLEKQEEQSKQKIDNLEKQEEQSKQKIDNLEKQLLEQEKRHKQESTNFTKLMERVDKIENKEEEKRQKKKEKKDEKKKKKEEKKKRLETEVFGSPCVDRIEMTFFKKQDSMKNRMGSSETNWHRKGLKSVSQKELESLTSLPKNCIMGMAVDDGGCFFDALAQVVNVIENTTQHSEKTMRMFCHQYYLNNKAKVNEWNKKDYQGIDKGEEYLLVQYTQQEIDDLFQGKGAPVWGRPHIEGRIICEVLQLKGLRIIEVLKNPTDKKLIASHQFVTKDGLKSIEEMQLSYDDNIPLLAVSQQDLHFVPILPSTPIQAKDIHYSFNSSRNQKQSEGNRVVDEKKQDTDEEHSYELQH